MDAILGKDNATNIYYNEHIPFVEPSHFSVNIVMHNKNSPILTSTP